VLFAAVVAYALYGYVASAWMWYARRRRRAQTLPPA